MSYAVVCSDGVRRHGGPYPTRREAVHAATWAWCYLGHSFPKVPVPADTSLVDESPTHPGGDGTSFSIDLAEMETQETGVPESAPVSSSLLRRLSLRERLGATDVGNTPKPRSGKYGAGVPR